MGVTATDPPGRIGVAVSEGDRRGWRWPVLLFCFFLSGIAGLVYQVAWTRRFALVFGSSELAVAAILAAFLGGLGLGAACAARLSPRVTRPILIYALLELIIAASALAVPWAIGVAEGLYVAIFGMQDVLPQSGGGASALFHLATAFLILSVPTGCMGATLPLLARFAVRRRSEIGSSTGALYAINTAGAVIGAPLAGFFLLPEIGLAHAVLVAVGLNLAAGAIALATARGASAPIDPPTDPETATGPVERHGRGLVLLFLVLISGAVSLVYEVFWTRLLGHLLGGSLTAFSTMLASFLAGIALGSALASRLANTTERGVVGFAAAQLGIAACTAASYGFIVQIVAARASSGLPDTSVAMDALLAAAALLPAAICIGATFPFAVRVLARDAHDAAPASARIYSWSTFGSIVGAVAGGLVLLPILGFAGTLEFAIAANLLLALAAALTLGRRRPQLATAAAVLLMVLVVVPPSTPWSVLRIGPLQAAPIEGEVVYHRVGRSATVLLTGAEGVWRLSSNGLPEGSIEPPGTPMGRYQVTRWLGSLAVFARPETRSMMVIGLGAGEALESIPSTVESIEVVELEPEVVKANMAVASQRRCDPLADPRVEVVINDARAALLLSNRAFDAIVSQPSHPWTSGSASLYTREFFELARERLEPDGVLVQWIGMAFIDAELLRSLLATLTDVFPHVVAYRPPTGAALLFLGSKSPLDGLSESSPALMDIATELPELGVARPEDLAAALVLDASGARALGEGAPLNRDDRNTLESRSSTLFGHGLGRDLGESVLSPWDPLVGDAAPRLDRVPIVRRLLSIGHRARARRLAETARDPVERQVALALVADAAGRAQLTNELLEDVLNRDPSSPEGRALFLRTRRARLARGESPDPRLLPLSPAEDAVVNSWHLNSLRRWEEIAALESQLASVAAGDPLFREVTRLRVVWRLGVGGSDRAVEAVSIIDPALARGRTPEDLLLRAHASTAAGDPRSTLASLSDLARLTARLPDGRKWVGPARGLLDRLPDDPETESWRRSVARVLEIGNH